MISLFSPLINDRNLFCSWAGGCLPSEHRYVCRKFFLHCIIAACRGLNFSLLLPRFCSKIRSAPWDISAGHVPSSTTASSTKRNIWWTFSAMNTGITSGASRIAYPSSQTSPGGAAKSKYATNMSFSSHFSLLSQPFPHATFPMPFLPCHMPHAIFAIFFRYRVFCSIWHCSFQRFSRRKWAIYNRICDFSPVRWHATSNYWSVLSTSNGVGILFFHCVSRGSRGWLSPPRPKPRGPGKMRIINGPAHIKTQLPRARARLLR